MNKPELGIKRDCPNCTARFYDLNKSPAHCPKCETTFVPEALLKPRKPRREDEPVEGAPAAPVKPAAEVPLDAADKDEKAAKSKRKPGLDDEAPADELADIEDIEIEDDEEDDTLLEEDEDEDEDIGGIVQGGDEEP